MPAPLKKQMPMRLSNVDTPNINRWANCGSEAILGEEAKKYVESLIKKSKKQQVKIVGYDKYGRWLGQIYLDGKSISDSLIEKKFARPYYGGKKQSWCNK
jgi:endonuclease YncB( thermonuclease family)